jgi:flagellar motor switch protein FliN/FliY
MRNRIQLSPGEGASENDGDLENQPNLSMILDLPLEVTVRLGQTKILIRDLLRLDRNSVLELDQNADDPLDIVVNDRVLARGEVVVIEDRLGIRITDIVSRAERVDTLA